MRFKLVKRVMKERIVAIACDEKDIDNNALNVNDDKNKVKNPSQFCLPLYILK